MVLDIKILIKDIFILSFIKIKVEIIDEIMIADTKNKCNLSAVL